MGCDISILSKHNLDIDNVEALAIDISNRFGFSIEFGYYSIDDYNKLLGNDLNEAFVSLGIIDKKPFIKKYILTDEKFQQKQLHQKYGDALFKMKEYWFWYDFERYNDEMPNIEKIELEKREIEIAEYHLDNHAETGESSYMYIHNEIVSSDLHYYTRWWNFCGTIQSREYFDDEYYQNFRKSVMKDTLLLGGNKAYFVNDQCRHLKGVGGGEEMYYNWEDLEKFIQSRETLELVSISKTVLDKQYRIEVRDKKENTLAFFDDFEDLL